MTFQTLDYVVFLLATLALYWSLNRARQNLLLVAASYVFYGYVDPWLALLLGGFTAVNYFAALGQVRRPHLKNHFLAISVVSGLAVLAFFKYFGFFADSVADALSAVGLPTFSNNLNIILPIGISFYTFQTLGYAIDVHRGRVQARSNVVDFALFVAFFPQLVSGPIERAGRLLPQFERSRVFDPAAVRDGLMLILWGFFKKLVIADNVGIIADKVFATESPGFSLLWVGVIAFGIQIFADFSGYTDIARGTARLFGFNLSRNFDQPFLARSPTDFWRRWHITLSTWFRDYLYIPLGGSRSGPRRAAITLMITFLVAGLWHGAAWNFVLWGAFHGVLILAHRGARGAVPAGLLPSGAVTVLSIAVTFVLMNVGWLIFREGDVGYLFDHLWNSPLSETVASLELAVFLLLQVVIYSLPLWGHAAYAHLRDTGRLDRRVQSLYHVSARTAAATGLFIGVLAMRATDAEDFIYFRF